MPIYNEIWKLLDKYKFELISELNVDKCLLCQNLVNNAYQGNCGCVYCFNCIKDYLNNGTSYCPGVSDVCKETTLVIGSDNPRIDNNVNRLVSKVVVKCPSKSCYYQSALLEMNDHLRLCDQRTVQCPFDRIGCTASMCKNKLKIHLSEANEDHNMLLVEYVTNVNNECLQNHEMNLDKIQQIQQRMESTQVNFNNLQNQFSDQSEKCFELNEKCVELNEKCVELNGKCVELNGKCVQQQIEINNLKQSNAQLKQQFLEDKRQFNKETEENLQIKTKLPNILNKSEEIVKTSDNINSSLSNVISTVSLTDNKNELASLHWIVEEFNTIEDDIESEYFYSKNKEYQIKLRLFKDSSGGKRLNIQFLVDNVGKNCLSNWPLKCIITIYLKNNIYPNCELKLTKHLEINRYDKPDFYFQYLDLNAAGVLRNNVLLIECVIVHKKT